jgi:hypothetical protein
MANDVDLLGLDKAPVGTLMVDDCGRIDREMRNGSGREIRATHESISCCLTDCAFRLDPVRGSGEVTGIAESQGWVVEHGIGQELAAAGSSR